MSFRRRRLVAILLIASPGPLAGQAPSRFEEAKARALLTTKLPCLGCHQLDGEGGRSAPELTTVGVRRSARYIAAILASPDSVVPGIAMPKTPMTPGTRDLLARYLSRGGAAGGDSLRLVAPAQASDQDGVALYSRWCASCHRVDGTGGGPNAPFLPVPPANHADRRRMSTRSDDQLFDMIAAGGAAMGRSPRMPGFGATLAPAQIHLLVGHLRRLCRCGQPTWSERPDAPPR